MRNLLKKPVFLAGSADWISELQSIIKQYINTIYHSIKMKQIDASKKSKQKLVYNNLQDGRVKQIPKYKLGHLVRTADNRRVFSKGDSTNYSSRLYTITEVIQDTVTSYRIGHLPERYNENLLPATKLSFDEKSKVMKELNLIQ